MFGDDICRYLHKIVSLFLYLDLVSNDLQLNDQQKVLQEYQADNQREMIELTVKYETNNENFSKLEDKIGKIETEISKVKSKK